MDISEKKLDEIFENSDVLKEKLLRCIIDDDSEPNARTLAVVRVMSTVIAANYILGLIKDDVSFDEYFDAIVGMARDFAKVKAQLNYGTGN